MRYVPVINFDLFKPIWTGIEIFNRGIFNSFLSFLGFLFCIFLKIQFLFVIMSKSLSHHFSFLSLSLTQTCFFPSKNTQFSSFCSITITSLFFYLSHPHTFFFPKDTHTICFLFSPLSPPAQDILDLQKF